jgi:hypothetical protein
MKFVSFKSGNVKFFGFGLITLVLLLCFSGFVFGDEEVSDSLYYRLGGVDAPKSSLGAGGEFQTSLFTGAASYGISFEVPAGTNSLAPGVGLSYSSQAASSVSGFVGRGWDLGLSYIERDVNYTPDNVSDDVFYLVLGGSQELVYSVVDGWYHTEVESYLRVRNVSGGSNQFGLYWVVNSPDGMEYRFGYYNTSNASSELVCYNKSYVHRWYLDQVTDTHGNKIFYLYRQNISEGEYGAVYPYKIQYNNDLSREVEFVFNGTGFNKTDAVTQYVQGCRTRETRRLTGVVVRANSSVVRQYVLSYDSGRTSLLTSVTQQAAAQTL